jgi:signal transduction histidine kinase
LSVVRTALAPLWQLAVGPDFPPHGAPRWWRRIRPWALPLCLLALFGLGVAAAEYLDDNRRIGAGTGVTIAVFSVLPALIVWVRPLWAWRIAWVGLWVGATGRVATEGWAWNPVQILGVLLVLCVVAARTDAGVAAWAFVFTLIPVFSYSGSANAYGVVVLLAVVFFAGDQIRRRRQSQRALAEQEELSELEKARRAVLEERARIAREMHDVVAHHMSMIAVQAETAPFRLPGMPEPAREEFVAIAGSARTALADMRRLLGVLRSDTDSALTAPQPGTTDVPELVAAARRAGMAVTLDPPAPPDVDGPVALAAYRIVQEALANAARHAPGAAVLVGVELTDGSLRVRVHNGPPTAPPDPSTGPGHGVEGMRERATLLGGAFLAGPVDDGGYAVSASLPASPLDLDRRPD